jgi:hypothetical protein
MPQEEETTATPRRKREPDLSSDLTPLQIAMIAALIIGVLIIALWLKRPSGQGGGRAPLASVPILHMPPREQAEQPAAPDDDEAEYPEL